MTQAESHIDQSATRRPRRCYRCTPGAKKVYIAINPPLAGLSFNNPLSQNIATKWQRPRFTVNGRRATTCRTHGVPTPRRRTFIRARHGIGQWLLIEGIYIRQTLQQVLNMVLRSLW